MTTPADDIRALLTLINTAAEDAIQQYESSGQGVPDIKQSTIPQLPADPLKLKRSIRVLEGATQQLVATLTPPDLFVYTWSLAPGIDMACFRVILNAKIPDLLAESPEGLSVEEIGAQTGLDPTKLVRIMRVLASKHFFREIASGVFVNNALSLTLRAQHPMNSLLKLRANTLHEHAFGRLWDSLADPEYGHSDAPNRCAFSYGIRKELPGGALFDWLGQHPEESALFNHGMVMLSNVTNVNASATVFPWNKLPQGSTVCDVGSGIGAMTLVLAKTYGHLNLTLQDLPHVLEHTKVHWAEKLPTALTSGRIQFAPMDFFKDSPLANQDVYFLRQIIHDWSDDNCIKILTNVAASLKPGSRVLINEYILTPNIINENEDGTPADYEIAPKPLLPSYGAGSARTYLQDMAMLTLLNSQERTLAQLRNIGEKSGLRFVRLWDLLETGLVEFAKADDFTKASWE